MDKNIIFSKKSDSYRNISLITTIVVMTKGLNMNTNTSIPLGMFASSSKKTLEKSKNPAYCLPKSVAKNSSGHNWHYVTLRCMVASLSDSGFFYACKFYCKHIKAAFDKMHRVMVDCMKKSSDLLLSLRCSMPISAIHHHFQLALKMVVVSKYLKEATVNV